MKYVRVKENHTATYSYTVEKKKTRERNIENKHMVEEGRERMENDIFQSLERDAID